MQDYEFEISALVVLLPALNICPTTYVSVHSELGDTRVQFSGLEIAENVS